MSITPLHGFGLMEPFMYVWPGKKKRLLFARVMLTAMLSQLSDEWADGQIEVDGAHGCLRAFAALKRQYQHLKVILSVGGGGKGSEPFAAVAANPQTRGQFALTARELVAAYGIDGIDSAYSFIHRSAAVHLTDKRTAVRIVDWEHPEDNIQGQNYILLLDALRRCLPQPYILTSALPAGEWALRHIDLAAACRYLDYINLMTYDFSGPWVDASGHHAQLYAHRVPHNDAAATSCHTAVSYLQKVGVPANQIVLGIPAYGRSFLNCNDIGQGFTGHAGEEGTFEYKDLPRPGASEHVDMTLGAAYCVGGDGGFVSYDNAQTVRQKAAYVKEHGLGGVFYWTATADNKGPRSLIESSFTALHTG
jgi:chitinase